MTFCHLHAHSEYSPLDGMSHVADMVAAAVKFDQPALAITDHGLMSGAVQMYKHARKAGIEPIIGMEAYLVADPAKPKGKQRDQRYHLTLLARNLKGYQTLVRLSSLSHARPRYHHKPRLCLGDFASIDTSNLTVLTGCYFGPLIQTMIDLGDQQALGLLRSLAHTFDHLYVEVQQHEIEHPGGITDRDLVNALDTLAYSAGLPLVITQDSHYCEPTHKAAHDAMKRLTIFSEDPDDATFPGDSFHLCSTEWAHQHYSGTLEHVWDQATVSIKQIIEDTHLRIPVLEKYRYYVPKISTDPYEWVAEECWATMKARNFGMQTGAYEDRLDYELDIIQATGFAGYFQLVADYVAEARRRNILVNARGSANGSLVCWLLGITNVDPVRWGLMVERFIDKARVKPPDIDLDIEQSRRAEVVEYIASRYNLVQIGTFTTFGFNDDEGGRGSLLINYLGAKKRSMSEDAFAAAFKQPGKSITSQIRAHSSHDLDMLRALDTMRVRKNPAVHAAGFVLDGEGHRIEDWIPTMLIPSSNTTVTQFTMDDVEDLGFIKIDLLGLRSLTVLRRCQELIGRDDPLDLDWIPNDDPLACKLLSTGVAENAVFQMEGFSMAKGVRKMKIRRTEDCVVAVALFRPALLETAQDDAYVARRGRKEKVTYPHPIFKKHLAATYGVPLYQESVLEILRDLGVPPEGLNSVLKAVKGKQGGRHSQAAMEAALLDYERRAEEHGLTIEQTERGWELIEAFASYGFNRAHSVAYGLMAYRAGYLKAHHPLEYMTAALESVAGDPKKEPKYLREARRLGIRILGADVNISGAAWSIDRKRKAIRRGLMAIKGIGEKSAEVIVEAAPFTDLDDFLDRTSSKVTGKPDARKGVWKDTNTMGMLRQAGALRSLGVEPL